MDTVRTSPEDSCCWGLKSHHMCRHVVKVQPKHFIPWDFCVLLLTRARVQSHVETHCAQYH